MHILITGAAGMIGRKLTERLVVDRTLDSKPIEKLTLVDIVAPARPAGFSDYAKTRSADLGGATAQTWRQPQSTTEKHMPANCSHAPRARRARAAKPERAEPITPPARLSDGAATNAPEAPRPARRARRAGRGR